MGNSYKRLTKKTVEHMAWLAKIKLSESEKSLFSKQLSKILDYFKQIDEVDTSEVEPTYHSIDVINMVRNDIVEPSLSKKQTLANASKKKEGYFKAPRIS
jgi:aspartyl-tRNA(Asn)/glutamyl-tRNA(Gln) amidotransferase subunit C